MSTRSKGASRAARPRILLVDDNRAGLIARRAVLEEQGHEITAVEDPQSALELFREGQFDVVVTDFRMPALDGIEFIARLREIRPHILVVLISGFVDSLGLNEANTGADAVVMKSSNEVSHLVRAVRQLLNAKARQELRRLAKPAAKEGGAGSAKKSRAAS